MTVRTWHTFTILATLVLLLQLTAPAFADGDRSASIPAAALIVNETMVFSPVGPGNVAPTIHREPEPLVTLLRLEWNATEFPGPRSMAFGPRSIEFTANPRALGILAAGAGIAVLAYVLYRKRKAGAGNRKVPEDSPETGDEKQG